MGQAILHFRKIKTGSDLANIAAHNCREKIMDETGGLRPKPKHLSDADPWPPEWVKDFTRIDLNEGQMGKRSESIGRAWVRSVKKAGLKRKPQNNASRGIEAIFAASAGSFEKDEEWRVYLEGCRDWAEKKFGSENILQWNTHYDETTPHLHMILIPIVQDDRGAKYSSSGFLGGPEGLRKIQDEFFQMTQDRRYGLTRGEPGSKAEHTDQNEWKSKLIKKEKGLDSREIESANRETKLDVREEEIKRTEENVATRKAELDVREEEIKRTEENAKQHAVELINGAKKRRDEIIAEGRAAVVKFFSQFYDRIRRLPGGDKEVEWIKNFDKVSQPAPPRSPSVSPPSARTDERQNSSGKSR
jgi:hypothetical protein